MFKKSDSFLLQKSSDPFKFLKYGGKKIVNFTITNYCNAKCKYCSFHKEQNKKQVSIDDAARAIDYLCEINTGVLSLTGGEPLLNQDLPDIVKYARKKGLIVYTGTNSIPITEDLAKDLRVADVSAVWISFESSSYEEFNKNRGVKGLHIKVKEGMKLFEDAGINVFAISLINKSIKDYYKLIILLKELGFKKVKFDYPISFELKSSYKGWSKSPLLKYNGSEMETAINAILEIKTNGVLKVINPTAGLLGAINFYKNRPSKYPCCAGEKVLYLDWNLDIYRCPALNEKMGHIGDKIDYKKINCNKCYYQGVRDFDAFYFLLEWLDIKAKGLQNLNPKLLFSALSLKDIEMLYECFKAGWEIKECDLI